MSTERHYHQVVYCFGKYTFNILKMHHKYLVPGTGNLLAINISVNII